MGSSNATQILNNQSDSSTRDLQNPMSESSVDSYNVASENRDDDLQFTVSREPRGGSTTLLGTGEVITPDGNPVPATFEISLDPENVGVEVRIHGENLSDFQIEEITQRVLKEAAVDLLGAGAINAEEYDNILGIAETYDVSPSITRNSGDPIVLTKEYSVASSYPESTENDGSIARERTALETQAHSAYQAVGGDASRYSGEGAAGVAGASGSGVDDNVIIDRNLVATGENNNFKYRSQGNVEGDYFSATPEGGVRATVSTSDRRPGFWNGNRAEIAFDKFSRSATNGFSSWFDVLQGQGFSLFQLFNFAGGEGFPEVMLQLNEKGELIIGGRAFAGKQVNLGKMPDDGKIGLDFKFNGDSSFSIEVLGGSAEAPVVLGSATGKLTQPSGEFHYRAGPYFDGYNNKQFEAGKNVTADVVMMDPKMIEY